MTDHDCVVRAGLMIERAITFVGISQHELARRVQLQSHSGVSKMVNGKRDMRVSTLFQLIDACGLDIVELRVRRKLPAIEAT